MRCLSKFRFFDSISPEKVLFNSQTLKFQNFHSKPSNLHKTEKVEDAQMKKTERQTNDIGSIFTMITEIIGTENLTPEKKDLTGISISQETNTTVSKGRHERPLGSPPVCRIANEGTQLENAKTSISPKTHLENPVVNDVSPIVHKITEILRAENDAISMEERLENLGFLFDSEIVENVLKRCFKVGHLALRFFNWVKLRTSFSHTTGTYNTVIFIAGEAKEFNLMEKLVEEMEKESCPMDIKTWTILISSYGKAKLIGKALMVFEKMRKSGCEPDEKTYKLIAHALCSAQKAEIAFEFYKEMVLKNMVVDMNLYKRLLSCLSGSGDISGVRLVGNDMMKVSQIPEQKVYSCILSSFCFSRRIKEALEFLHELKSKNVTLDPENFEILVKGLCRDGEIASALEIVDIMKQNRVVDGKVYAIIVNGYLKKDEVSKAFEVFDSIKKSGHIPTLSTYTELMQHLFRLNEYERACKLYEEMLENGVEPDTVAITALVAGHVQHNHVSEAWEVFNSMKEKGIKATKKSYTVFIKELCKVSRTDDALKLLIEMRDSKTNIGDEIFLSITLSLEKKGEVESLANVKQIWRAFKLHSQESELDDLPTSDQSLCGETKTVFDLSKPAESNQDINSNPIQPVKADVLLLLPLPKVYNNHDLHEICRILSSSVTWIAMQEALEKCTVQFTPELVLEVLRSCQLHGHAVLRFFSWVEQQPGYRHTTETYNMAIKISGCAKDFKHMRTIYYEMRRRGCVITSDTWTIMIMQYGRVGLTEIALKKLEEMKADGCEPNGSTYKYLIMFLSGKKGRKVEEAIKTFNEMINAGYVPDKELAEIYLNCLCEEGKLTDARRCMESLHKGGFGIPLGYSLVIRALCRAGKLEAALELLDETGPAQGALDQHIYGSIVHGLLRGGRLDEALAKVETMKQRGINPTVHIYTSLMVHFFKEKQIEKALEIFKKLQEDGCEPTIVTYSALIRGYMNMGMVFDAWNVFRRMKLKGPFPDFKTYSMFMTCLCKMDRSEEALQLIYEMLDSGIFPSTVNFRTVFYGLNREGKQYLAHTVLQQKWALMNKRKFLT